MVKSVRLSHGFLICLCLVSFGCLGSNKTIEVKEKIEIVSIKTDSVDYKRSVVELQTITVADTQKYVLVGIRDTQGTMIAVSSNNGDSIKVIMTKDNKVTVDVIRKGKSVTKKLTTEQYNQIATKKDDTNKVVDKTMNKDVQVGVTPTLFANVFKWLMFALILLCGLVLVIKKYFYN
jgi:hypothetical protein